MKILATVARWLFWPLRALIEHVVQTVLVIAFLVAAALAASWISDAGLGAATYPAVIAALLLICVVTVVPVYRAHRGRHPPSNDE